MAAGGGRTDLVDEKISKRSRRVVEVPSENHPFVFESRRNFASSSAGCQNIIGMEPALNAAMKVINRELVTSTTATGEHRKPPAVAVAEERQHFSDVFMIDWSWKEYHQLSSISTEDFN